MEGSMLLKIFSQISPNLTRFGVIMELSVTYTRRVNILGDKTMWSTAVQEVPLLKLKKQFIYVYNL